MKKIYLRPESEQTFIIGAWDMCDGSVPDVDKQNNPGASGPPAPKKRGVF